MESFGVALFRGFLLRIRCLTFLKNVLMACVVGQDSWPLIDNIGDDTPADIRAIFDQSNIGFEQEELPCVEF